MKQRKRIMGEDEKGKLKGKLGIWGGKAKIDKARRGKQDTGLYKKGRLSSTL